MSETLRDDPATNTGRLYQSRPGLLVSVRDADEAQAAIRGGTDWVDLKEPSKGPLGAVGITEALQVAGEVAERRPLSAALGELRDWLTTSSRQLLDVPQISHVKLGLAKMEKCQDWPTRWHDAEASCAAAGKLLVAVVYADWQQACSPSPMIVMRLAEQSQARCLLIDTYDKQADGTLALWGAAGLSAYVADAKSRDLSVVLAGRLERPHLAQLPIEQVDLFAIRGAACMNARTSSVDESLVLQFKHELVRAAWTSGAGPAILPVDMPQEST